MSEIGFGAWGIGGNSYGPVDDNVSREALRLAFDLGVNFFDTSDVYGEGHSEKVIGETLKDVRGKTVRCWRWWFYADFCQARGSTKNKE